MIAIFTAMKGEVAPFIDYLGLKSCGDISGIKLYSNERYLLAITGMGKINAACAVTRILTLYDDIKLAVNIGTCAGEKTGQTYLINKITDEDSSKDYYPDMLYKAPFDEICLHTSDSFKTDTCFEDSFGPFVYDMEGAAFFAASSSFLSPDKVILLKTVSDSGDPDIVTADYCKKLLAVNAASSIDFIEGIYSLLAESPYKEADILCEEYSTKLKCSEYMRNDLKQLIRFALSCNKDIKSLIESHLPVKNKEEGKKVLADVRQKLVE